MDDPENAATLAQLRTELDLVKAQLAELKRFLKIEHHEDGTPFLGTIRCSVIQLCTPDPVNRAACSSPLRKTRPSSASGGKTSAPGSS